MSGKPIKPIIIKKENLQKLVFTDSFGSPSRNIIFINPSTKKELILPKRINAGQSSSPVKQGIVISPVKQEFAVTNPIKREFVTNNPTNKPVSIKVLPKLVTRDSHVTKLIKNEPEELILPDIVTEDDQDSGQKYIIIKKLDTKVNNVATFKPQGNLNFLTSNENGKKVIYIQKRSTEGPKKKMNMIRDFKVTSAAPRQKKVKVEKPRSPSPVPYVSPPRRPIVPKIVTLDDVLSKNKMEEVYIPVKTFAEARAATVNIPIRQSLSPAKRGRRKVKRDLSESTDSIPAVETVINEGDFEHSFEEESEDVKTGIMVKEEKNTEIAEEVVEEENVTEDMNCELIVSTETEQQQFNETMYQAIISDETVVGFQCDQCGMQCQDEEEMTKHLMDGHTFSYQCIECNYMASDIVEAQRHFAEEHGMTEQEVEEHAQEQADEDQDSAEQEESQLEEAESEEGQGQDVEEEQMEESQLDEDWQASEDYTASVVLVNECVKGGEVEEEYEADLAEPALCHYCSRPFYSSVELERHVASHDYVQKIANSEDDNSEVYCVECDVTLENKREWTKHILNTRKHKDSRRIILNGCRYCGETFPSPHDYRAHIKEAHPNKAVRGKWPTPRPCSVCGEMFQDSYKYFGHFKREHPNEPYPRKGTCNYKCNECPSEFRCQALLKLHMNKHLGLKPFKCNMCPKTFHTSLSLRYHYISHSDVRPFKCETCGRAFKFKAAMERHQLVHTGERPYVCGVCNQGFTTMHWTQLHVRKVHNNEHIPYKPRVRRNRNKKKEAKTSQQ